MEWSWDLLCTPQRNLDFGPGRFLRLLHERAHHDDSAHDGRNVKCPRDSITACQSQFPQLSFQMFDMWLSKALEPRESDAFGESQKARLHVCRKAGDLLCHSFIEELDAPRHQAIVIFFLR